MTQAIRLDNLTVVLHRPRYPENIGAVARAARNMGVSRLRVVDPERFEIQKVFKMATHGAADLVKAIELFSDLESALADFQYVAGTTARTGGQRQNLLSPRQLARNLIPISSNNRIALVFGPEDRGLTNAEIALCHALVRIPTADFSSLNLSQAVMVLLYELFVASLPTPAPYVPRLANRHELEGMYAQLETVLVEISFINADNPRYWVNTLRRFFNRLPLRAKEVQIIRGICRQIAWYGKKSFEAGQKSVEHDYETDPIR